MKPAEVIQLFRDCDALLDGHFLYTSGRHGRHFLQASRVLQYPDHTGRLCKALAEPYRHASIDMVIGPATGGIILAYETARQLNCRAAFTEKEADGGQALKRGIPLVPESRVLVVEDIVTTGGSVKKAVRHLRDRKADVVGVAVLIDRSGGEAEFECEYTPLAEFAMESWLSDECPLCQKGKPLVEPDDLVR